MKARIIALSVILVSSSLFADDSEPLIPRILVSPDTSIFVRVDRAEAKYYRRDSKTDSYNMYLKVDLPSRYSPADVFVDNDGTVVLLDEWGSIGFETVVSVLDPKGKLVRSFSLEDIYTELAISDVPTTSSNRWWRNQQSTPRFTKEGFMVSDCFANKIFFDVADGSLSHRGDQPHRFRNDN